MPKRSSRRLPIASVMLAALALGLAAIGRGEPAPASPRPPQDPPATGKPVHGWSTTASCVICHSGKEGNKQSLTDFVRLDEVDQWKNNDKHHAGFTSLTGKRGQEMQARLGWSIPITTDNRCLACHAPAALEKKQNQDAINEGVSCVACHGANLDWATAHGSGDKDKQIDWIETPAKVKRDKFGMTDLRNPVVRSEVCASCHVGGKTTVGDKVYDRVVTHEMYAAGHPPLPGLEVSTFSKAEPPHWWSMQDVPFFQSAKGPFIVRHGATTFQKKFDELKAEYRVDEFPTQYAKLVAVGGVVTFRESMNLFVQTQKATGLPDFARQDCAACHHDLTVSDKSFRQKRGYAGDPGRPPAADWPAALVSVAIEAGDPAQKKARLEKLQTDLAAFHKAVAGAPFGDDTKAVAKAKDLAKWADGLIKELEAAKFTRATAIAILKQIASIEPPDHPSARQLAWSFKTVYEELTPKLPKDKEITATIAELIGILDIGLTPGKVKPGTIEREVGARLDADEKFDPDTVEALFARLKELVK